MKKQAEANLAVLTRKSYVGRGIIVGLNETGENLVQLYFVEGRSAKSRNPVFGYDDKDGRVFTEIADQSLLEEGEDTSLILYNALCDEIVFGKNVRAIVSNGCQTNDVWQGYLNCRDLHTTMNEYDYEPDAPNFTPRITAVSFWSKEGIPHAEMSILRKSPWSDACDRNLYEFNDIGRGFGHCVTTYSGDGDPLPSFRGEPYMVPLDGSIYDIANTYWNALDPDNVVSLAVKFIPRCGRPKVLIRNKYQKKV